MDEETLLTQALELPRTERAAFLSEACGNNKNLRQRVEDLINAYDNSGGLPDSNEADPVDTLTPSEEDHRHDAALAAELSQPIEQDASDSLSANPDAPVPFIFGERIARGGMGAILEADDCKFGRKIAVKVMLTERDVSEEQKLRFIQEAAVLGKLEHPNIVPVHDLGRDSSGDLYYSMKLVKGRTLQNILDRVRNHDSDAIAQYPLDRLLTIFRKVCDALAFAHSENIIHRDLKPENIMVGEFGEVLVMDWGLSKILHSSRELIDPSIFSPQQTTSDSISISNTLEGSVIGSPRFMSPEQAKGEVTEMDTRTDIYSLGGILYAILTLRPPIEGRDVYEVLSKVQQGEIAPCTTFEPNDSGEKTSSSLPHLPGGRVPLSLSAVAMKALSIEKDDRYQSVFDLSTDVEKWQKGFATSAEDAGFGKQLALLMKRNKGIAMTSTVAWLLITGLAVWFIINLKAKEKEALAESDRATKAEAVALQSEETARQSEEIARQKEGEARQSAAKANLALAEASLREGNCSALLEALTSVPEDLRDSTWQYFMDRSDTSISEISTGTEIHDITPHPVLASVFAVADKSNTIRLINVRKSEELYSFAINAPAKGRKRLAISPDGKFIAVGSALPPWMKLKTPKIAIYSTEDGSKVFESASHETTFLGFSPDGSSLLQAGYNKSNLTLWDMDSKTRRWSIDSGFFWGLASRFISNGNEILLQCHNSYPVIVSASDGSRLRTVFNERAELASTSEDEQRLVTLDEKGRIRGYDLEDRRLLFDISTGNQIQWFGQLGLTFSTDNDRFVTALPARDGTQAIQIWDANNGSPIQSLLGGTGEIRGAVVHPISSELVVIGKFKALVWNLGEARWTYSGNDQGSFAFWGDESLVLSGVAGKIRVGLTRLSSTSTNTEWTSSFNATLADVSANGKTAVISKAAGATKGLQVQVLRREGTEILPISGTNLGPAGLTALRLSPEGNSFVAIDSGYYGAHLVDANTGNLVAELRNAERKRFTDFAWLSENRLLGLVTYHAQRGNAGAEERIVLWDASTNEVIQEVTHPSTLDAIAASPDGKVFAEAGFDRNVRIRDAETLEILKEFRAHDGTITALAWHPHQPVLATASADLRIRIWNLETGDQIDELRGPRGVPRTLNFSPSGQRLGCASFDSRICIWEPPELQRNKNTTLKPALNPTSHRILTSRNWPAISTALVALAKDHPDDTDAWNELPGLLNAGEHFAEADEALSKALAQSEEYFPILLTRGRIRAEAGQWAAALEDLEGAMKPSHPHLQDFALRAQAYANLNRWEEASLDWTAYIAKYPNSYSAFEERALAYLELGEWKKCYDDFERAIEFAPYDKVRSIRNTRIDHYWLPRGEWEAASRDAAPVDLEAIQRNWSVVRNHALRQILYQKREYTPSLLKLLKEKLKSSDPSSEQIRCSLIALLLTRDTLTQTDANTYASLLPALEKQWSNRLQASIRMRASQDPQIAADAKDTWLQLVAAIHSQRTGAKEQAIAWFKKAEAGLLEEFEDGARHHVPSSRGWIEWAPYIVLFREAADRIEGNSDNAERRFISSIEKLSEN